MKYTFIEGVFLVNEYTKSRNIHQVQTAFQKHFNTLTTPTRCVILYNYNKFNKSGSIHHIPLKNPKITTLRLIAKNEITILIDENPALSLRKLCSSAEISFGTA